MKIEIERIDANNLPTLQSKSVGVRWRVSVFDGVTVTSTNVVDIDIAQSSTPFGELMWGAGERCMESNRKEQYRYVEI